MPISASDTSSACPTSRQAARTPSERFGGHAIRPEVVARSTGSRRSAVDLARGSWTPRWMVVTVMGSKIVGDDRPVIHQRRQSVHDDWTARLAVTRAPGVFDRLKGTHLAEL